MRDTIKETTFTSVEMNKIFVDWKRHAKITIMSSISISFPHRMDFIFHLSLFYGFQIGRKEENEKKITKITTMKNG